MSGKHSSGRRTSELGQRIQDATLRLLEIHSNGATAPELAAYMNLPRTAVEGQLANLLRHGKVYKTKQDAHTTLWHLTPQQPSLTTAPPARSIPRAHTRSR